MVRAVPKVPCGTCQSIHPSLLTFSSLPETILFHSTGYLRHIFHVDHTLITMEMTVGVAMTTFSQSDKLLNGQEANDASKNPQPYHHVLHVVMVMVTMVMGMAVGVTSVVVLLLRMPGVIGVIVGRNCVRDQVKKSVPQKPPRGEAEEHLEQGGVLRSVVERDEAEDEERGRTDHCCGDESVGPLLHRALERRRELHEEVPGGTREC